MQVNDVTAIAEYCRAKLDLANVDWTAEERYSSLPLCVIDAVYSINANYTSTANTVGRFCRHFGLRETSPTHPPDIDNQLPISALVRLYEQNTAELIAETIYQNKQRTSTRGGILKSEAVLRFARVLQQFSVDYFQDIDKVLGKASFENAIEAIPGQRSGLSIRYFYMLAGSDDYIKPDRMIGRFVWSAIQRDLNIQESHDTIVGACTVLQAEYPGITPRRLDKLIWQYQREL